MVTGVSGINASMMRKPVVPVVPKQIPQIPFSISKNEVMKVQENYQDKKFEIPSNITSVRPYPSIVMRANHTIMSSVAATAAEVMPPPKVGGKLSAKLIA